MAEQDGVVREKRLDRPVGIGVGRIVQCPRRPRVFMVYRVLVLLLWFFLR
jgi:hypothetical protein